MGTYSIAPALADKIMVELSTPTGDSKRHAAIPIMYFAHRHDDSDPFSGVRGFLRFVCIKLLHSHELLLKLAFATTDYQKRVQKGDVAILLDLFKRILYDVASSTANGQPGTPVHCLVVDGVHILEAQKGFSTFVNDLRELSDKLKFGELGQYLRFKYLFIHPQITGSSMSAAEQRVFLGGN